LLDLSQSFTVRPVEYACHGPEGLIAPVRCQTLELARRAANRTEPLEFCKLLANFHEPYNPQAQPPTNLSHTKSTEPNVVHQA
jgi:hypothetical protein